MTHTNNNADVRAASKTRFFTMNGTSLFFLKKETNLSTCGNFNLVLALTADDGEPSLVKGEPK